jgi:hypothetical protein
VSGIVQSIAGITGLTSSNIPNITNPFTPLPLPTAASSFGDLSSIGLTPDEIALSDFLGLQQDTRTRDIYSRLGLGGSTMEAQDLGSNELQRLAESANLETTNRGQAIQEQQVSGNQQLQEQSTATNAGLQTQNLALQAANAANRNQQQAFTNLSSGLGSLASSVGSAAAA